MQRRLPRESWTRLEKLTRLMSMKAIVVDLSDIDLRDLDEFQRSMGRVLDTLACLPEGLRIVEHQVILA